MPIIKDGLRLARLNRSIGVNQTTFRPLYPIQVAKYIKEMKDDLNESSNKKIANRLGVKHQLIADFLTLLDAPRKYDDIWGFGRAKGGRLPWTMCRRMSQAYNGKKISEEEFGMLVNGALNNEIPPKMVDDIIMLKKRHPEKPFEDCCKEILNLVPEKITSIIFIADLDSIVIEKIRGQAQKESKSEEEIAESVLSKYVGSENLEGVLIKNDKHIKIALNEKGRKKLDEIAKQENKQLVEIITHLFLKEGFGNE